ncbi:MAG: hypothetical protein ACI9GM_000822 [Salibacteraceae bacterium]|jgi:hypothetical protein
MNKTLSYLIVCLVCLGSCNPELPTADSSAAVFFVKGVLNGQIVELSAGDNSYYMYPSVNDDSLGIRYFSGLLGKVNCQNQSVCPETFQISIRELEIRSQGRLGINENIKPSRYIFRGPPEYFFTSYKASFFSKSFPIGLGHVWDFGDGTSSNEINPEHYYLNQNDSIVTPVLWVTNGTGCDNSVSFETRFSSPCEVDFTPKYLNGHLSWSSLPNAGRTELWDLTNGYMPLGPANLPPLDSVFTACVKSTDASTGCVSYKCKNIVLDTNLVQCVANYDVIKETVVSADVRDYAQATISYINEAGEKYASDLYDQPIDNYFEIVEVEDYTKDENGNSTKKITIKCMVRLYGESETDFLDFTSEKSIFAISYL